jgi:hypothetical protein
VVTLSGPLRKANDYNASNTVAFKEYGASMSEIHDYRVYIQLKVTMNYMQLYVESIYDKYLRQAGSWCYDHAVL